MRRCMLIVMMFFFTAGAVHAGDKITPIKGILVICAESLSDKCPERVFDRFIMSSPVKFLTRKHLDLIMEEQRLQMSGLTEKEKTIRMGRLLGASHILLYNKEAEEAYGNRALSIRMQVINVETSEIEYTNTLRWHEGEYGDRNLEGFFKSLTEHWE